MPSVFHPVLHRVFLCSAIPPRTASGAGGMGEDVEVGTEWAGLAGSFAHCLPEPMWPTNPTKLPVPASKVGHLEQLCPWAFMGSVET